MAKRSRAAEGVAREGEVLEALSRILRREETETVVLTSRERVPTLCDDGKVHYAERTASRVARVKPKLSDVNRAAELLGKRHGLWTDRVDVSGARVCIVDDVTAAGAAGEAGPTAPDEP